MHLSDSGPQFLVTDKRFLGAQEAKTVALAAQSADFYDYNTRWPHDWHTSTVFLFARLQLDQMIEVLNAIFDQDVSDWSSARVSDTLERLYEEKNLDPDDAFEIDMLGHAAGLRQHLPGAPVHGAGRALDGSPAFTVGPDVPEFRFFSLDATHGEYDGDANKIFDIAHACTSEAPRIFAKLTAASAGKR